MINYYLSNLLGITIIAFSLTIFEVCAVNIIINKDLKNIFKEMESKIIKKTKIFYEIFKKKIKTEKQKINFDEKINSIPLDKLDNINEITNNLNNKLDNINKINNNLNNKLDNKNKINNNLNNKLDNFKNTSSLSKNIKLKEYILIDNLLIQILKLLKISSENEQYYIDLINNKYLHINAAFIILITLFFIIATLYIIKVYHLKNIANIWSSNFFKYIDYNIIYSVCITIALILLFQIYFIIVVMKGGFKPITNREVIDYITNKIK